MVTTGNEVYSGRIQDKFGPAVSQKLEKLGSQVFKQIIAADDKTMIAQAVKNLLDDGADMIIVTGGMSVDADDCSLSGVKSAGGKVIAYGAPVLPGSMFLMAYIGKVPVLGLPACVLHSPATIFDLIIPRILAGEFINRYDLIKLGHGGLCSCCQECRFPSCSFGK